MTNLDSYYRQRVNPTTIWLLFLFFGWSYGSLRKPVKQIFFYLTIGGLGLWMIYRLCTLNRAIRGYNRRVAIRLGLTLQEMAEVGLE